MEAPTLREEELREGLMLREGALLREGEPTERTEREGVNVLRGAVVLFERLLPSNWRPVVRVLLGREPP